MGSVDPSCELERLVIIVEIVLELSCEQDCSQHHLVCIEIIESELTHLHVVAVDIDDSDDEALGWEASVLMQSFDEVMEGDVRYGWGVKDGLTGSSFLLDEIFE